MLRWSQITEDPEFQTLPDPEKQKVRSWFYTSHMKTDPGFMGLPETERQGIIDGVFKGKFKPVGFEKAKTKAVEIAGQKAQVQPQELRPGINAPIPGTAMPQPEQPPIPQLSALPKDISPTMYGAGYEQAIAQKQDIQALRDLPTGDMRIQAFMQGVLPIAPKNQLPENLTKAYPYSYMGGKLAGIAATYMMTGGVSEAVKKSPWANLLSWQFKNNNQALVMMADAARNMAAFGSKELADQLGEVIMGGGKLEPRKRAGKIGQAGLFGLGMGATIGIESTAGRIAATGGMSAAYDSIMKFAEKSGKMLDKEDVRDITLMAGIRMAVRSIKSGDLTAQYKQARLEDFYLNKSLAKVMHGKAGIASEWASAKKTLLEPKALSRAVGKQVFGMSEAEMNIKLGKTVYKPSIKEIYEHALSNAEPYAYQQIIETKIPGFHGLPKGHQEKIIGDVITKAKGMPISQAIDTAAEAARPITEQGLTFLQSLAGQIPPTEQGQEIPLAPLDLPQTLSPQEKMQAFFSGGLPKGLPSPGIPASEKMQASPIPKALHPEAVQIPEDERAIYDWVQGELSEAQSRQLGFYSQKEGKYMEGRPSGNPDWYKKLDLKTRPEDDPQQPTKKDVDRVFEKLKKGEPFKENEPRQKAILKAIQTEVAYRKEMLKQMEQGQVSQIPEPTGPTEKIEADKLKKGQSMTIGGEEFTVKQEAGPGKELILEDGEKIVEPPFGWVDVDKGSLGKIKEPWEMTKAEFEKKHIFRGVGKDNIDKINTFWSKYGTAKNFAMRKEIKDGKIRIARKGDVHKDLLWIDDEPVTVDDILDEYGYIGTSFKELEIKPSYEIPEEGINDPQKYLIKQALAQGKNVPQNILAEHNLRIKKTTQAIRKSYLTEKPATVFQKAKIKNLSPKIKEQELKLQTGKSTIDSLTSSEADQLIRKLEGEKQQAIAEKMSKFFKIKKPEVKPIDVEKAIARIKKGAPVIPKQEIPPPAKKLQAVEIDKKPYEPTHIRITEEYAQEVTPKEFHDLKYKEPGLEKFVTPVYRQMRKMGVEPFVEGMVKNKIKWALEEQDVRADIDKMTAKMNKMATAGEKLKYALIKKPTSGMERTWNLLNKFADAKKLPDYLTKKEKEVFIEVRDFTQNLLNRVNEVRGNLGIPQIKDIGAYIPHFFDEITRQMIKGELPATPEIRDILGKLNIDIPESMKYISSKYLSSRMTNPTEFHRKLRGEVEKYFSRDINKLLKTLAYYDLRDIYLAEPYSLYKAYIKEVGDEVPATVRKEMDNFVRYNILDHKADIDEWFNHIAPLRGGIKFTNKLMKPFGRIIADPAASLSKTVRFLNYSATIPGRPLLAIRNTLQQLLLWDIFPFKHFTKAIFTKMPQELKDSDIYKISTQRGEHFPSVASKIGRLFEPTTFRKVHGHSVRKAMKTGYLAGEELRTNPKYIKYFKKLAKKHGLPEDTYLWTKEDSLKMAELAVDATQWIYFKTFMPPMYRSKLGAMAGSLASWPQFYAFGHWHEMTKWAFSGQVSWGKPIPPSWRLNGLKGLVAIFGLTAAMKKLWGLDYKKSLFGTGPLPTTLNPAMNFSKAVYDYTVAKYDWQRKKAARQMERSWPLFIPGYLAGKDIKELTTGKKDLKEYLFYTER